MTECPKCQAEIHYRLEKRVDTRLVAEMVKMAALNAFDRAIVFSGDEDLVPALETVASFGKQVYVATWGGHALSRAMRIHSFGVIDLVDGLKHFAVEISSDSKCLEERSESLKIEELYTQLLEAWNYFNGRDGHVTKWYFENKWKSSGPCPPPGNLRQQMLDRLIASGKVELFEAIVNGRAVLALRPKR